MRRVSSELIQAARALFRSAVRPSRPSVTAHSAPYAFDVYVPRVSAASFANVKCNIIYMLMEAPDPSCQPKCFFLLDDVTYLWINGGLYIVLMPIPHDATLLCQLPFIQVNNIFKKDLIN